MLVWYCCDKKNPQLNFFGLLDLTCNMQKRPKLFVIYAKITKQLYKTLCRCAIKSMSHHKKGESIVRICIFPSCLEV